MGVWEMEEVRRVGCWVGVMRAVGLGRWVSIVGLRRLLSGTDRARRAGSRGKMTQPTVCAVPERGPGGNLVYVTRSVPWSPFCH